MPTSGATPVPARRDTGVQAGLIPIRSLCLPTAGVPWPAYRGGNRAVGWPRRLTFVKRLFGFPELRDWLLTAGFAAVRGYGADGRPLTCDHKRMVIVADLLYPLSRVPAEPSQ